MVVEVYMPKMSDHMESGEIVRWIAAEGQIVSQGQPLVEINTDKVTTELEAPASGILKTIRSGAEAGALVPVGETIALITEQADEDVPKLAPLSEPKAMSEEVESAPRSRSEKPVWYVDGEKPAETGTVDATPLATRLAERHGIDLSRVTGSGPRGRIGKEDIMRLVEGKARAVGGDKVSVGRVNASPAARRAAREAGVDIGSVPGTGPGGIIREADVDAYLETAKGRDFDWVDLTPVQRITGQRMLASITEAPQFYLEASADAGMLLEVRSTLNGEFEQAGGTRLSITTLLVKIVALALQKFPILNSSFEGDRIKQYRDVNVGVAVGTAQGLVVPVIRSAERKTITQIHNELQVYKVNGQSMSFTPGDFADGHFTLSNLGMYGVDRFRAIVNPPQCAVLAVGRIAPTPTSTVNEKIELRPLVNLGLTVDHRCLDGMQGAQFLACIKELVENPIASLVRFESG